ncbi:MAG: cytochrome b561 domain-containing protein, partial [Pseudomonadota bacterium]
LAPLAVMVARYFKVVPGQDWPRELDNQIWWKSHWKGQLVVLGLTLIGVGLVWQGTRPLPLHGLLGYTVLIGVGLQILLGLFRGTKGGPTAPQMRGDHYDMTRWRRIFESVHKSVGYTLLALALATTLLGLWLANGPRWMWLALGLWWAGLVVAAIILQLRGHAIDTYQAIWGPDPRHHGNRRRPGWGMRRPLREE